MKVYISFHVGTYVGTLQSIFIVSVSVMCMIGLIYGC